MQHQLTLKEMLEKVGGILDQPIYLDEEDISELKETMAKMSIDVEKEFAQKSENEKAEMTRTAHQLHFLLQPLLILAEKKYRIDDQISLNHLSLWLSYYFPFNEINKQGEILCPRTKKILNKENSFVSAGGYYYSIEDLVKNESQIGRFLSKKDIQRFKESYQWVYKDNYDFYVETELARNIFGFVAVTGMIAGLIIGGIYFPPLFGIALIDALTFGFLAGSISGMCVGGVLGYMSEKIYQFIHAPQLKTIDVSLPFSTPSKPFTNHLSNIQAKKSVQQNLNNQFKKITSAEKMSVLDQPSKAFNLLSYFSRTQSTLPPQTFKLSTAVADKKKESEVSKKMS